MIVDVHTHLPTHDDPVPDEELEFDTAMRPGRKVRLTNSVQDYLDAMGPVDAAFAFGIAPRPGDETVQVLPNRGNVNDAAAALASRAPDKIIGFMSVHPDEPDVMDEIERSVHDLGLRGMKLGPNYQGFDPVLGNAFRVYGKAQELGAAHRLSSGHVAVPGRAAPIRPPDGDGRDRR